MIHLWTFDGSPTDRRTVVGLDAQLLDIPLTAQHMVESEWMMLDIYTHTYDVYRIGRQ